MKKYLVMLAVLLSYEAQSQVIYVVRHAEKATVAADAPAREKANPNLSEQGLARAQKLGELLKDIKFEQIWSTGYLRTQQTVTPLATANQVPIQVYHPHPDSTRAFVLKLASSLRGTAIIAGHSNTVDDIVNIIAGQQLIEGDLDESVYDNLFILRKEGEKFVFELRKY